MNDTTNAIMLLGLSLACAIAVSAFDSALWLAPAAAYGAFALMILARGRRM